MVRRPFPGRLTDLFAAAGEILLGYERLSIVDNRGVMIWKDSGETEWSNRENVCSA